MVAGARVSRRCAAIWVCQTGKLSSNTNSAPSARISSSCSSESTSTSIVVEEVNQGGQEQSHGIHEIAKAVSEMQRVTQQSAEGSEQSPAAGQELDAQTETMRDIVGRLGVLFGGATA